jgi:hypothetical protein
MALRMRSVAASVPISLAMLVACSPAGTEQPTDLRTDAAAQAAFEQCMQNRGYSVEDMGPPTTGRVPAGSVDREFETAKQLCALEAGTGSVDGDDPEEVAEQNARATEMTQCMRDRGWDVADPELAQGPLGSQYLIPLLEGPPGADAETAAAFSDDVAACGGQAGIPIEGEG